TPGRPVSRPWVAAMKAADCSWRVRISLIRELRSDSTTSRFSSPGMPKILSTPSFSSAATRRSEPFFMIISKNIDRSDLFALCAFEIAVLAGIGHPQRGRERNGAERRDIPGEDPLDADALQAQPDILRGTAEQR